LSQNLEPKPICSFYTGRLLKQPPPLTCAKFVQFPHPPFARDLGHGARCSKRCCVWPPSPPRLSKHMRSTTSWLFSSSPGLSATLFPSVGKRRLGVRTRLKQEVRGKAACLGTAGGSRHATGAIAVEQVRLLQPLLIHKWSATIFGKPEFHWSHASFSMLAEPRRHRRVTGRFPATSQ
jgi:hypothetical protein